MKNLRLKIKMRLLVGFIGFGLVVLGAMSLVSMKEINAASTEIAQGWLPGVIQSQEMNTLLFDFRLYEYSHIIVRDEAGMQKIEKSMEDIQKNLFERFKAYPIATQEDQELLDRAQAIFTKYLTCHDQIIAQSRMNNIEEAENIIRGEALELFDEALVVFADLIEYNTTNAEKASLDGDNLYYTLIVLTSVVVIGILLASLVFCIFIFKSIQKPVKEMVKAAEAMANGDLAVEIKHYTTKDEIGDLSVALISVTDTLKVIIKDIDFIMREMSIGNFDIVTQARDRYIGDFQDILTSMRDIRVSLGEAFSQIGQSADQVASGSEQVSNGAQALSQGSTEQASSVQELTATINEVADKVAKNAQNAELARTTTEAAKHGVDLGNHKMQELVKAMANISETSSQIEKIIKTIDDIAFQTNILALNAAVEAARAGEAGKGFAVVADEVRNLASKSAQAAKNITGLIETSISAVEAGKVMVDETAQSLESVVDGAQRSSDIISEISVASNHQSSAIMQISQGMDQISAVVETNSATAEESAAASEELSGQAQVLKELLARFKFSNESAPDEPVLEENM